MTRDDSELSPELDSLCPSVLHATFLNCHPNPHTRFKLEFNIDPGLGAIPYEIIAKKVLFVKLTFVLLRNNDRERLRPQARALLDHFADHSEALNLLFPEANLSQSAETDTTAPWKPSILTVKLIDDDFDYG